VTEARVAVLLSGRGSNFLALAEACREGSVPASIALVLSDVEGAQGIERASELGLETRVVPHAGISRAEHEARVQRELEAAGVQWICLAGYMRLLSEDFVREWPWRILNVHPSLLPSFPGLRVHEQALEHGVRVSGCTVHLVDAGLDSGPIVVQRAVPVLDEDDPARLAERILEQEHLAYPEALRRLLEERWEVVDGRRLVFASRGDRRDRA